MNVLQLTINELRLNQQWLLASLLLAVPLVYVTVVHMESSLLAGFGLVFTGWMVQIKFLNFDYYFAQKRERLLASIPVRRTDLFLTPYAYFLVVKVLLLLCYGSLSLLFAALWEIENNTLHWEAVLGYCVISFCFDTFGSLQTTFEHRMGEQSNTWLALLIGIAPAMLVAALIVTVAVKDGPLSGLHHFLADSFNDGSLTLYLLVISAALVRADFLLHRGRSQFNNPERTNALLSFLKGGK